jgi:hypothetical protein
MLFLNNNLNEHNQNNKDFSSQGNQLGLLLADKIHGGSISRRGVDLLKIINEYANHQEVLGHNSSVHGKGTGLREEMLQKDEILNWAKAFFKQKPSVNLPISNNRLELVKRSLFFFSGPQGHRSVKSVDFEINPMGGSKIGKKLKNGNDITDHFKIPKDAGAKGIFVPGNRCQNTNPVVIILPPKGEESCDEKTSVSPFNGKCVRCKTTPEPFTSWKHSGLQECDPEEFGSDTIAPSVTLISNAISPTTSENQFIYSSRWHIKKDTSKILPLNGTVHDGKKE